MNRIDYAKKGWKLLDENEANIEYRSQFVDPNGWLSAEAKNEKTGQMGKIWWYWPKNRRNIEDGGDWVKNWDKCHDIEVYEVEEDD